jgi:hypothetical protein
MSIAGHGQPGSEILDRARPGSGLNLEPKCWAGLSSGLINTRFREESGEAARAGRSYTCFRPGSGMISWPDGPARAYVFSPRDFFLPSPTFAQL